MGIRNNRKEYLISITTVFVVAAICYGLTGLMGYRVVALILLLAVSLLAISFNILPVLISAALSAFIWGFCFIPPRFTIHVAATEDRILLLMYFIIALINGVLTYKIKRAEKKARLKEERANSVKLYNTILNSLSHELRTPIAAIIGATDNLQSNINLTEKHRIQLIAEISKASFRLNQQVENLLNISRLESGHIKPKNDWYDIVELVYEVVKQVEENNPGRRINISMNQDMPLCWIDRGMLEQVLYNLLNNAAVHTDRKSKIDIMTYCHTDLLEVIIEDDGQGFQETHRKNIFHKFSREKIPKTEGSGLGLSIVKGFTEALGGNVELNSRRTEGSSFVLSFPVRTSFIKMMYD
jgi:two-component system sensor histidine kinase KdpD